jgi:exosome complex exonuclease RRP6
MDMEKPQLQFEHVPTNKESWPFKPLLTMKPHALAPLETEPVAIGEQPLPQ